jgi:hypothetical protein
MLKTVATEEAHTNAGSVLVSATATVLTCPLDAKGNHR